MKKDNDKRPVGRPPAIKTPNVLEEAIVLFNKQCKADSKPFTLIGLAVFMGIDRDTLKEYAKKQEYSATYKKAQTLAEEDLVTQALTGGYNPTISIFLLKNNHGYKDKSEQELTHSGGINVFIPPQDEDV